MALSTQQKLDDALDKYHKLSTGMLPRVFVDQNGERVEFSSAKSGDLYLYIQRLQLELANAGVVRPLGPVGFVF